MSTNRTYLSPPHLGTNAKRYLLEALESNWIAPAGPFVDLFATTLQAKVGCEHAPVLTNSGSSALHVALRLAGVGAGDLVLCSDFTFIATAGPITYLGARPVFVDCEVTTWNMDPQALEDAIRALNSKGKRPKALVLAHCYGVPGFLDDLFAIAARHGIAVIEDAAEALGSQWKGNALGTLTRFGIYSFNGNKICTTSSGGALLCASAEDAIKARWLIAQCKDPTPHFEHREVGYNYGMSNLLAAVGLAELEELESKVATRCAVFDHYYEQLAALLPDEQWDFQAELPEATANRWLSAFHFSADAPLSGESLRQSLAARNIESRPLWKPMHLQQAFADCAYYGAGNSEKLFGNGICLPSGAGAPVALLTS
jgi:pyridoxal phosphate-dependent aminotransferase EpsN